MPVSPVIKTVLSVGAIFLIARLTAAMDGLYPIMAAMLSASAGASGMAGEHLANT